MIIFATPWDAMTLQIQVKDPEFGDHQDRMLATMVFQTMDGAVRTSVKQAPIKLVLEFRDMSRVKAIELRDFIVAALGKKMRYVDYEGVSWVGYILDEPKMVTEGRGPGPLSNARKESVSMTVDFEGAKL